MKNLTEDDDLQFYIIGQHESSIFRALACLNLHCWLYSSSRSTFLKPKQKSFRKYPVFNSTFTLNTKTFRN